MQQAKRLLLPGDPGFQEILGMALPPGWQQSAAKLSGEFAFLADAETGALRVGSFDELDDYIEGGEYEARLRNAGDDDALDDLLVTY